MSNSFKGWEVIPSDKGWELTQSGKPITQQLKDSKNNKMSGQSLFDKRSSGSLDARNFTTGGTANLERRLFPFRPPPQEMTDMATHASRRVKELPQVFTGLAFAKKSGWIQAADILTVGEASFQRQSAGKGLDAAYRALGQTRVNGIAIPHLALLRGTSLTFVALARPYASVDFIPSKFNLIEWQWFESEKGKGAGARLLAQKEIREFLGKPRGFSEADILEAVEKTTELAIITPLKKALERCDDKVAADVLQSELDASKEAGSNRSNQKQEVSRSLAELETARAIDKT